MQRVEEQAFGDSYKKKEVIVANSDDYGEESEVSDTVGGFGGAPRMKVAKVSRHYKGSTRPKEETAKSSSSNPTSS